ncbi:NUDIX domain-containing protein [Halobacillus litoralis]|uniref:NUDIX domain-containing protein n=1 Tax=Halobacillus litoralis TaxID=45668 RepID=UPI00136F0BDA|nr:NUDIX domain-containing protein [Halobacillus litoralis]MYL39529.1 NUDIX domain-containing protein [Halobacillus litoralis]
MSHTFIVNVEAAIMKDSRILLIQRSAEEEHAGGLYSLPGGKMEFSPDSLHVLEDNVRREIKEEIGITLGGELTYVHSSTFLIGDTQVLNLVFLATDFTGEPWIRSPEEVSGIVWIDPGEREGPLPIPPWTADSIRKAVERHTKIYF